jgi:hypothetical protein
MGLRNLQPHDWGGGRCIRSFLFQLVMLTSCVAISFTVFTATCRPLPTSTTPIDVAVGTSRNMHPKLSLRDSDSDCTSQWLHERVSEPSSDYRQYACLLEETHQTHARSKSSPKPSVVGNQETVRALRRRSDADCELSSDYHPLKAAVPSGISLGQRYGPKSCNLGMPGTPPGTRLNDKST